MYSIIFLAVTSFLCCYALTPLVRNWSRRIGWVDTPNTRRNLHAAPTPRTGGIAVCCAYLLPLGLLLVLPLNAADIVHLPLALRLFPAIAMVFVVGLFDDVIGLSPWQKLAGQTIAAVMAYLAGVQVTGVAGYAAPGLWALPITVFWLLACANAFNLIDGVDGVAAGVGFFAALTTLVAALLQHNTPLALATAPLVGALLAFLRYNFNPASIFLGDGGSMTIGFVLGCCGAIWSQKSATVLGMTAPLVVMVVPLLDTALSIVRRFLRSEPIFAGDRNHIHHRLLARGMSPRQVALVLYGACGLAAAFSLLLTVPGNRMSGLLLVMFAAAVWVGIQMIGYAEFDAARRLVFTGSFRHILNARLYVSTMEERCASARTPEDYWAIVRDVGREFRCSHVRMLFRGSLFEERRGTDSEDQTCAMRVPLPAGGYVNFRYPVDLSVRHAVAISALVEILQRAMAQSAARPLPAGLVLPRPALVASTEMADAGGLK